MSTPFTVSLASARVNAKLTQEELAKILGVTKKTVNNWEAGVSIPNSLHLKKISELSKIPMDYIFLQS